MPIIEVEEVDFHDTLNEEFAKGQVVILKFTSEYCDACMALGFELEEIDEKYEHISILEIDAAESESLTQMYGVTQVPTMIIYEDANTPLWNKEGVMLAVDIENIIGL